MNQRMLDYISVCSVNVPHTWNMDDIFREVAAGGKLILVCGEERWCEREHEAFRRRIDDISQAAILEARRNRIRLHDGTVVDFVSASLSTARFAGYRWDVAFLDLYEVTLASSPSEMPVWRIPPQADWHTVQDACDDALEFLRTHEGEVEFDFQGNRYKVPYGCDYAVLVGSIMPSNYNDFPWRETRRGQPEPRFRFGFEGWRAPTQPIDFSGLLAADADPGATTNPTYAGIQRSPAPPISQNDLSQIAAMEYTAQFNTMNGNATGAAVARQRAEQMMEQAIQQTRATFADNFFRESPLLARLRTNNSASLTASNAMTQPIQFQLPNSFLRWNRDEPMEMPDIRPGPSAREQDLQRRLDTVREILFGNLGDNATVTRVVYLDAREGLSREFNRHISGTDAMRLDDALSGDPVQDLDSYVYRYEFANGQAIKVNDKLECGTILDAAARPVRKFRIVEG